jgi:N-hydroxyarylamine O-acetyltransferase
MDPELLDAYLQRIGAKRPERADAATLRYLQERHVLSVPFENIAFHMGEPVPHSEEAVRKVVVDGRGGSCFELNTAFALLLEAFGFRVALLGGRIYRGKTLSSPFGHLALRVETAETAAGPEGPSGPHSWLVDVGQGSHSRWPLRLDIRTPQVDPHGTYQLEEAPDGDIDLFIDGAPLYRMEMRARTIGFCRPFLWWYQTAPDSPFAQRLVCIQPREDGKVTLAGRLLIREQNGTLVRERITTEDGMREAYRTWFGIQLDQLPKLPERAVER